MTETEGSLVFKKTPGKYIVVIHKLVKMIDETAGVPGMYPYPETRHIEFKNRDVALAFLTGQIAAHPDWIVHETTAEEEDSRNRYLSHQDPWDRVIASFHITEPGAATPY